MSKHLIPKFPSSIPTGRRSFSTSPSPRIKHAPTFITEAPGIRVGILEANRGLPTFRERLRPQLPTLIIVVTCGLIADLYYKSKESHRLQKQNFENQKNGLEAIIARLKGGEVISDRELAKEMELIGIKKKVAGSGLLEGLEKGGEARDMTVSERFAGAMGLTAKRENEKRMVEKEEKEWKTKLELLRNPQQPQQAENVVDYAALQKAQDAAWAAPGSVSPPAELATTAKRREFAKGFM